MQSLDSRRRREISLSRHEGLWHAAGRGLNERSELVRIQMNFFSELAREASVEEARCDAREIVVLDSL